MTNRLLRRSLLVGKRIDDGADVLFFAPRMRLMWISDPEVLEPYAGLDGGCGIDVSPLNPGKSMFEKFQCEALRRVDVSVSGEWRAGATRDWLGQARGPEPIVAISFAVKGGRVSWCKSGRATPEGQPVRLLLGHYDSAMRDVQVNFSVGDGGVVSRTVVDSPTYRPSIFPPMTITTARFTPFTTVEGASPVQLFALFLVGSDVKVGRNRLWHLRPKLAESVPTDFRKLLTYGRTGEWDVAA